MTDTTHEKRRAARNVVFSVIAWFFPILVGFVATPILVRGLGAEQYGLYALVLGFLSYSFTFGIGKAVAKFIPEYRIAGENAKLSEVISATLFFSLAIALLGAVTIALLASYLVSNILLIPVESRDAATTAFYLASATGLVTMVGQTFQFVLQGLHRFGSYVLLTNLNGLMLGGGNILLVLSGFGVVALVTWSLFTAAFTAVLFFIQVKRLLPEFSVTFRLDRSIRNAVIRYGGNIILFQIFGNLLYVFERVWVTRKFGPQGLAFYSVPMLLAIYMHGVIASFAQGLFPQINELLDSKDKLISLYQKATKIVLVVVTLISVAYFAAGRSFLSLWVNADFAMSSYDLLIVHSLTFAFIAMAILSLQIAEAFRFSTLMAIITGIWMILSIPLMVATADPFGSFGVALSRLAGPLVTFPLIFWVEHRFFGRVLWQFWLAAVSRIALAALPTALVGYQIFHLLPTGWAGLVAGVAGCVLVFGLVLFVTGYLTRSEREFVRDLLFKRRQFRVIDNPVE